MCENGLQDIWDRHYSNGRTCGTYACMCNQHCHVYTLHGYISSMSKSPAMCHKVWVKHVSVGKEISHMLEIFYIRCHLHNNTRSRRTTTTTTVRSNDTLIDTPFQLLSGFFHANQGVCVVQGCVGGGATGLLNKGGGATGFLV